MIKIITKQTWFVLARAGQDKYLNITEDGYKWIDNPLYASPRFEFSGDALSYWKEKCRRNNAHPMINEMVRPAQVIMEESQSRPSPCDVSEPPPPVI